MMVEAHVRGDVLDMTWVRFNAIMGSIPIYQKLTDGKGLSPKDHIELQKLCAPVEL